MEEEEGGKLVCIEDNIYDFKGISLDLDALKIPLLESSRDLVLESQQHEDYDEDEWCPGIPPIYDVKDRLLQLNEELKRDPNWTERQATKLKWNSQLEHVKWFNGSTDAYPSDESSSDNEDQHFQDYEDYLSTQYRLSPTLLASITSDSSSESSILSLSEKKEDLSCYYSGTFFHLENKDKPCQSSNCLSDHSKDPSVKSEEPPEKISIVSPSHVQLELKPGQASSSSSSMRDVHRASERPQSASGPPAEAKHAKKRLSINSLVLEPSSKPLPDPKEANKAFALWKIKKKHEKLLSERLNYLKLQKRRNSHQRL